MKWLRHLWRYCRALLLGRVGKVGKEDIFGTPLHTAALNGDTRAINALLDAGADINEGDSPPLHLAIFVGRTEAVRLLLERGASTEKNKPDLQRSLAFAIRRGNREIIELLAEAGVKRDPNIDCFYWKK